MTVLNWSVMTFLLLNYPAFVCECTYAHDHASSGLYPQKCPRNHTVHAASGKTAVKVRGPKIIPAVLKKREHKGKTKSTANTKRNVA